MQDTTAPLPHEPVTVGRYLNFIEARIHWSLLRAEGLDAHIIDEHTGVSYNYALQAMGGMRLQVPVHQATEARRILDEVKAGQRITDGAGEIADGPFPAPGGPLTQAQFAVGSALLLGGLAALLSWLFYA